MKKHQLLVHTVKVNLLGENESLTEATNKVDLKINAKNNNLSCHLHAEQNHNNQVANKSFER
jgi:hypothetical protein